MYECIRLAKQFVLVTTLFDTMLSKHSYFIFITVLVLDEAGRLAFSDLLVESRIWQKFAKFAGMCVTFVLMFVQMRFYMD